MQWFKSPKIIFLIVFILLMITLRLVLEPIIERRLNTYLQTFSPILAFRIADIDLNILRGKYTIKGMSGSLRAGEDFILVKKIILKIPLSSLFDRISISSIDVNSFKFTFNKDVINAFKAMARQQKDSLADKEGSLSIEIERLRFNGGEVIYDDSLNEGVLPVSVSNINGQISNLDSDAGDNLSPFTFKGTILEGDIKVSGNFKFFAKPLAWDVDSELFNLNLIKANDFLKSKVPMTFTKGALDLFAEVKSEHGKIEGYVKPFIKDADIVDAREEIEGPKHWVFEVLSALGNLVLRTNDTKTVATKIPFSYDRDGIHIDSGEALNKTLEHGFEEKLNPQIENMLNLKP